MLHRSALALAFALGLAPACADEELIEIPEEPAPEPAPRNIQPEPEPEPPADPPPEAPPPPPDSGDECAADADCGPGSECDTGVCVGVGVMQVTLAFDADADFDLHVITPSGEEVYFANPSAAGGVLDVDTCVVECGAGTHIENVFFNEAMQSGVYTAYAENYDGRDGGAFTIEVSGAANTELSGFLDAIAGSRTPDLTFTVQ